MKQPKVSANDKKKHHFVPISYLKGFTNPKGMLRVYIKDEPDKSIWSKPDETGFRNFYYSQPLPDGCQDNNTLEDHFSRYESAWPAFVDSIRRGDDVNDRLDYLLQFLMLQHTRVPATRETVELILADQVVQLAKSMDRQGLLPPKPAGHEDILEHCVATIDPHKSIHAMAKIAEGFSKLLSMIGLSIIENTTGEPFITCDNPVIWFDPSLPPDLIRPHSVSPDGPVMFYFPITRDLALLGTREAKTFSEELGLYRGQPAQLNLVEKMNDLVARFAYQAFYAGTDTHGDLMKRHRSVSPTVEFHTKTSKGQSKRYFSRVFGERKKPEKWKRQS